MPVATVDITMNKIKIKKIKKHNKIKALVQLKVIGLCVRACEIQFSPVFSRLHLSKLAFDLHISESQEANNEPWCVRSK